MGKSILDNREAPQKLDGPPKVEDVLAEIASRWLSSTFVRKADQRIPTNPQDLATWWIKNQSQPHERFDKPTQQSKRDGGVFWKTPYIDRVAHTLKVFLTLENGFQGLIIAAAEDGIFWRGDSREFFISLIAEHSKMRNNTNYRQEVLQKLRKYLGGT